MTRPAVVLGVVLAAGCVASGTRTPHARNIVIVTLDTTRADRLPAYGFRGIAAPVLERMSREGTTFDNAESVVPLTLPAHTSIFTGLYPLHHGVRDNMAPPLDAAYATLAEVVRAKGFHTGAFVGSAVLRGDRGLAQGFDTYDDGTRAAGATPRRRTAAEVVDEARAWIEGLDRERFFVWVHLYDAHAPQTLPPQFRREYGDSYDGAIAYMDAEIGRLLDALKHRAGDTAILVAADHGESLGEHGEREHGIFLYEGALHVPLIVRAPGVRPRRVSEAVSLVDVLPTALDLLGFAAPDALDGRSLLPAMRGERLPARTLYAESMYAQHFGWSPLRMLRDERLKYIDAPRPELFDLVADPFEERNLASQRPLVAAAMHAELEALGTGHTDPGPLPSADTLRELAALGYVQHGSNRATVRGDAARPDPKDYIQVFNNTTLRRATPSR